MIPNNLLNQQHRVLVFHDMDNARIHELEQGKPFINHIVAKIAKLGHIEQYRMYLTNQEFSSEFGDIVSTVSSSLGTFRNRFTEIPIQSHAVNALDAQFSKDFFAISPKYYGTYYLFLIISGDIDFISLRWYGDVFRKHVYFLSPTRVRSAQLEPYSI